MLILISDAFDASLPERLTQFGEVTEDKDRLADADVVLIRSKTKCTQEYIDSAPKLKLIIRGGVGLDNVDLDYAKKRGVTVHNTPGASSVAVAELALTLMLSAINHVVAGHNGMAQGKWLKKELKRTELYKKNLGLLGAGRIATEVATRAKAFGMDVIAHDAFIDSHDHVELVSLDDLLKRSDVISLHTPLTDQTRGLIGADQLAQCKDGVVLVNTARGPVVDEAAMIGALESKKVACYATDVWSSDPPPDDCALLKAPRVLMLPHIGASSRENLLRVGDEVVRLIGEFK